MIIYEVKFAEGKAKKKSAYFSNNTAAQKFILDMMSYVNVDPPIKHTVTKLKSDILKFLNRDNGIGEDEKCH